MVERFPCNPNGVTMGDSILGPPFYLKINGLQVPKAAKMWVGTTLWYHKYLQIYADFCTFLQFCDTYVIPDCDT